MFNVFLSNWLKACIVMSPTSCLSLVYLNYTTSTNQLENMMIGQVVYNGFKKWFSKQKYEKLIFEIFKNNHNYWDFFRSFNIAWNDKIKIGKSCMVCKGNGDKWKKQLQKSFWAQYPGQNASQIWSHCLFHCIFYCETDECLTPHLFKTIWYLFFFKIFIYYHSSSIPYNNVQFLFSHLEILKLLKKVQ
jgi:hypothetical protein